MHCLPVTLEVHVDMILNEKEMASRESTNPKGDVLMVPK